MNNLVPFHLPEVSLIDLGWNLAICILLTTIIAWHYSSRAKKKTLRRDLALVLPIIALTTLLVISVVKSSLALSLGLVGALSIVRFRTPIKEPEELAYIFLAIAIGLSLGADQRETAALSVLVILAVITSSDYIRKVKKEVEGNLLITLNIPHQEISDSKINEATSVIMKICENVNIRRIDKRPDFTSITCIAIFENITSIENFEIEFGNAFPKGSFSIIDVFKFPNE